MNMNLECELLKARPHRSGGVAITPTIVQDSGVRPQDVFNPADRFGWRACLFRGNPIVQFGEPDVIIFILAWCGLSLVGTLFALSLIRAGKKRQPEADDLQPEAVAVPAARKH